MNLGGTIKKIRKEKKIKQNTLAENCGITATYLSQIENNKKEPGVTLMKNICNELDISTPLLFFKAMDINDVPKHKREKYNFLRPSLESFVDDIMNFKTN